MMLIVSYIFGDLIIFALDFWQANLKKQDVQKKPHSFQVYFFYVMFWLISIQQMQMDVQVGNA